MRRGSTLKIARCSIWRPERGLPFGPVGFQLLMRLLRQQAIELLTSRETSRHWHRLLERLLSRKVQFGPI